MTETPESLTKELQEKKIELEKALEEIKKKETALAELDKQLTAEIETSKARKEKYDNLINYLAGKYGTPADEELIRGQVEAICQVEGKLDTANETIKKMQETHTLEKKDILAEIEILKTKATEHIQFFEAYTKQLHDIEGKVLSMIQKEVKTNHISKLLEKTKKLLKIK